MRRNGVRLTFNSDLPGTDWNIFYGLYAAVARKDKNHIPVDGWYPEQKMSPEEALRGFTIWAAYSSFMEEVTGTLEPGKCADITITDIDILNTGMKQPENLLKGNILMTLVNGKIVYKKLADPSESSDK